MERKPVGNPKSSLSRGHRRRVTNVWQFLRDNWLSNCVFRGYDDIVAHCCDAWSELTDPLWRIKSIGHRTWANGF